jgi:hypothetical protein
VAKSVYCFFSSLTGGGGCTNLGGASPFLGITEVI